MCFPNAMMGLGIGEMFPSLVRDIETKGDESQVNPEGSSRFRYLLGSRRILFGSSFTLWALWRGSVTQCDPEEAWTRHPLPRGLLPCVSERVLPWGTRQGQVDQYSDVLKPFVPYSYSFFEVGSVVSIMSWTYAAGNFKFISRSHPLAKVTNVRE